MLNPYLQKFAVDAWKPFGSTDLYDEKFLESFNDTDWIQNNSAGDYQENEFIESRFRRQ
jgi:hypothetical protein